MHNSWGEKNEQFEPTHQLNSKLTTSSANTLAPKSWFHPRDSYNILYVAWAELSMRNIDDTKIQQNPSLISV